MTELNEKSGSMEIAQYFRKYRKPQVKLTATIRTGWQGIVAVEILIDGETPVHMLREVVIEEIRKQTHHERFEVLKMSLK